MKSVFLINFFLLLSLMTFAQGGIIKGKITDAKTNEPIISANVIITGTTTGTVTDLNLTD